MEDSGIDSGDAKPIRDITLPLTPTKINGGITSSRLLQRRLGPRNRNQEYKKSSGSLLPLQRLPIPGTRESQALVAWDTDESEEEVVSFFPARQQGAAALTQKEQPQDALADGFSVEELSPTDEDEDDGDDLELVVNSGQPSPILIPCCPKQVDAMCCLL